VLRRLGFGLLVTLVLGLLMLNVLAWAGGLVDEEGPPAQTPAPPSVTPTVQQPALEGKVENPRSEPIARTRPARRDAKPGGRITLVLTASRGDCWVEARAGSATGETLYAGMLSDGSSLRFNRPKVWLRLGAASNVDIEIDGRRSAIPSGTVELVLPDA
jgi:hypothetical protein